MRTKWVVGIIVVLGLLGAGVVVWQVIPEASEHLDEARQSEPSVPAEADYPVSSGAVAPDADAGLADSSEDEAVEPAESMSVRIHGTLTERRGGSPIAGAKVRLQPAFNFSFDFSAFSDIEELLERAEIEPFAETETTDSGSFSVELVLDSDDEGSPSAPPELTLLCLSEDHVPHQETVSVHGRSEMRLDVQLLRAAVVKGHVLRSPEGVGIGDVQVMATQGVEDWRWDPGIATGAAKGETTREDGAFELNQLAPGRYSLGLSGLREHGLYFPAGAQTVYVEEGEHVDGLELEVEEGGRITGKITNLRGEAVTGARVEVIPAQFSTSMMDSFLLAFDTRVRTDDEGFYTIAGLPLDGEFTVHADASDYAPSDDKTVVLTAQDREATADFTLGEGSTVSGYLLRAGGEPYAEQSVALQNADGALRFGQGRLRSETETDGAFRVEHVPPGRYTLIAGHRPAEYEDGSRALVTIEEGRNLEDLRFIVTERDRRQVDGVISGYVNDSRGNPVEDASVTASMGPIVEETATTGSDGRFTIEGLWPGDYTVTAQAGGEIAEQHGVPIHAEITLNLFSASRIEGLVMDNEGGPAEGVAVSLVSLDQDEPENEMAAMMSYFEDMFDEGRQRTDRNGLFEFEGLTPGRYRVTARDTTMGTGESEVIFLGRGEAYSNARVRLERGVRVTGRVQDPSGQSVSGVQVRLVEATDNFMLQAMVSMMPTGMGGGHAATTDRQGQFEIVNVPPGSYDLVATHRSYARARLQEVNVRRGADRHGLRVIMSEGGSVRGQLTDSSGNPLSGGVVLMGPGGFHMINADSEGNVSATGLAPGGYLAMPLDMSEMMSDDPSVFPEMGVVDIMDGEEADLHFGPSGSIPVSGQLDNYAGQNAVVSIRRPGGPHPGEMNMIRPGTTLEILRHQVGQAIVGPDGSFQIEGIEPGEYLVDVLSIDEEAMMHDPMNMQFDSLYEGVLTVGEDDAVELNIPLR